MVTLDEVQTELREPLLRIARRHGAHNVRVFGSLARGEAGETSDLDLLFWKNTCESMIVKSLRSARFRKETRTP